jgi:hypothetical protein
MAGIVLTGLYVLIHLIFTIVSNEETGTERVSDLPESHS